MGSRLRRESSRTGTALSVLRTQVGFTTGCGRKIGGTTRGIIGEGWLLPGGGRAENNRGSQQTRTCIRPHQASLEPGTVRREGPPPAGNLPGVPLPPQDKAYQELGNGHIPAQGPTDQQEVRRTHDGRSDQRGKHGTSGHTICQERYHNRYCATGTQGRAHSSGCRDHNRPGTSSSKEFPQPGCGYRTLKGCRQHDARGDRARCAFHCTAHNFQCPG